MKKKISLVFLFLCQLFFAQNTYLKINGNNETENITIDSLSYKKEHKDIKSILDEINLFSNKLMKNGYLEIQNGELKKLNDSTYLQKIKLNKKCTYISIFLGKNKMLLETKEDSIKILIPEVELYLNRYLLRLEKKGYSLAKIQLTNFKKNKNKLNADLSISLEVVRTLNDIIINGYEKFPNSHKKNIVRLYKNKVFNRESLNNIQNDFSKLKFVTQTKSPEILFTKDSVMVYVYLEKSKPNSFEGFLGFGNDENKKLIINGYLDLTLQNILNGGEKFSLYWKSDGKNQKTFNTAIEIPYVFKSPLSLKSQLNIFKQDSLFQNTKTAIQLGYLFKYSKKLYLGYENAESSNLQNSNSANITDFSNKFISVQLEYSKFNPEDLLFPDKTYISLKFGNGKRVLSSQSNHQNYMSLDIFHNIYLNNKNVIHLKNSTYYLKSERYIINELFRFGGINSIRGFNENSLQANLYSLLLTEYRYVVNPSTYLYSILDYGYFKDKATKTTDTLLAIGIGFGIKVKSGMFNLIYSNGGLSNQTIKLSNSIVHLSLKSTF